NSAAHVMRAAHIRGKQDLTCHQRIRRAVGDIRHSGLGSTVEYSVQFQPGWVGSWSGVAAAEAGDNIGVGSLERKDGSQLGAVRIGRTQERRKMQFGKGGRVGKARRRLEAR